MKVLLYQKAKELNLDLDKVSKNPEVVITYGGDGALLGSERDYPGVPKLPLRNSDCCYHCQNISNEELIEKLKNNDLKIKEYTKIEAQYEDKKLISLNDIVIRNSNPVIALRFKLIVNGIERPTEFIGDGVVVATPFGSTGYFFSIARKIIDSGIGLAFNNLHNYDLKSEIFDQNAIIEVKITRGEGLLVSDNNPEFINLPEEAVVKIKKSNKVAKMLIV